MAKVKEDLSRVRLEVDGKQAINQLGKLEMEAKELRIDLKNAKKGTEEYIATNKKLKAVEANIKSMRKELGLTGMTMSQLSRYQRELRKEIQNTTTKGTAEYKQLKAELLQVNKVLTQQRKELAGTAGFFGDIKKELKSFAVLAVGALGITELIGRFQNLIRGSAELSDQFSDVQKTTELTKLELEALMKEFKTFNTRTPRAELLKLADEAGKMGIRGVKNIASYVQQTNELTTALGDLGDNAGLKVAKMADRFDVSMRQIGSGINAVADNTKATAPFITEFLSRLSGIANEIDIKAGDILGYGAAIDEMGLNVEMSSTALNNFFIDFTKNTEAFGEAAGFAEGELSKLVGEQGANEGFLAFLERLKEANPESAEFLRKLEQLGIDGTRGSQVFLALSQNVDQLRSRQALANAEIAKGTSLTEEYNRKNENFAGNLERIQKWFAGFFVNGGVMDTLNEFVGLWAKWIRIPISQKLEDERTQLQLTLMKISDTNIAQDKRVKLIEELKAQYPQYLADINSEKVTNNQLATSIAAINKELVNKIILQSKEEELQDSAGKVARTQIRLWKEEEELMREMIKISEEYNLKILTVGTTADKASNLLEKAAAFTQNQEGRDGKLIGPTAKLITLYGQYQQTTEALNVLETQNNLILDEKNKLIERLGINMQDLQTDDTFEVGNPTIGGTEPTNEDVQNFANEVEEVFRNIQVNAAEAKDSTLVSTELMFDQLIKLGEKYNVDMSQLEEDRAAERKRNQEQALKDEIDIANAKQMIAQGLSVSLSAAIDFIGNRQGELTGFQKMLTIAQIAIDSAAALGKIVPLAAEASAGSGPAAPFVFAGYIATMAGTVLTAIARAKQALTDANVPDWNPDNGPQDNSPRQRAVSAPRSSFYYGGYTGNLGMGTGDQYGEFAGMVHQREYVIPEVTVSDPYVANLLPAIEQIRQDNIRGFSSMGSGMNMGRMEKLLEGILSATQNFPKEIKGKWVYSDLEELEEEDNLLKSRYRA
jgi:TP901 family phage tail tape measure protein